MKGLNVVIKALYVVLLWLGYRVMGKQGVSERMASKNSHSFCQTSLSTKAFDEIITTEVITRANNTRY